MDGSIWKEAAMPLIDEHRARAIEAFYRVVASLAIIAAGFWTMFVYSVDRAQQTTTATLEAQKPFLEKQLEYYLELSNAASTIAVSKDSQKVAAAKERFWQLYYGQSKTTTLFLPTISQAV